MVEQCRFKSFFPLRKKFPFQEDLLYYTLSYPFSDVARMKRSKILVYNNKSSLLMVSLNPFTSPPKLYIPSTLNIDLILWHPQLIADAIKC